MDAIIEQVRNDPQRRIPKKLQDQPELFQGLELYYRAFSHLNSCRPAGFSGAYPIPWTAIKSYADTWGFDDEQFELLEYYVSKMDGVYLKWAENQNGKSEDKAPNPGRKFGT
jgi:hypothetical protein